MISTSQFRNARWLEKDDRLLRAMSKAGEGLTLMTVKPNRPMTSVKVRAVDSGSVSPALFEVNPMRP
ncbi:hypothetical protein V1294_006434 [Bradyrhizobium sp. AZCC 1678]|jgi:hypothetical protein|uniref:Uncharacterized protein n=1 Tax=Bradyrhizobium algeriense TaxID=634784 RepID=A0ABU8BGN7_9BRAD